MSWNAKRSSKTTISKGLSLYQVSLSTFHADRKKIVNIILQNKTRQRLQDKLYLLIYYWSVNSSIQHIQKGSPMSPIHIVDSFVVDIVMPSFTRGVWSTQVYIDWIVAWFQWFELTRLYLDISK